MDKYLHTSTGVALKIATLSDRSWAFLLDLLFAWIIFYALSEFFEIGVKNQLFYKLSGMGYIFYFAVFAAYQVSMEEYWGASAGKMMLRIRVCDRNGEKPNYGQSVLRNFLKFMLLAGCPIFSSIFIGHFAIVLSILGWFCILVVGNKDPQGFFISDYPTKTYIVEKN